MGALDDILEIVRPEPVLPSFRQVTTTLDGSTVTYQGSSIFPDGDYEVNEGLSTLGMQAKQLGQLMAELYEDEHPEEWHQFLEELFTYTGHRKNYTEPESTRDVPKKVVHMQQAVNSGAFTPIDFLIANQVLRPSLTEVSNYNPDVKNSTSAALLYNVAANLTASWNGTLETVDAFEMCRKKLIGQEEELGEIYTYLTSGGTNDLEVNYSTGPGNGGLVLGTATNKSMLYVQRGETSFTIKANSSGNVYVTCNSPSPVGELCRTYRAVDPKVSPKGIKEIREGDIDVSWNTSFSIDTLRDNPYNSFTTTYALTKLVNDALALPKHEPVDAPTVNQH